MTLTLNLLIGACLAYGAFLFVVAAVGERQARRGRERLLRGPVVYTLSLSIYCTAWTFYGAVGYAARSGLEFMTIYLGPTLVFVGWWWLLRKLVAIGRAERVTSIADMLSSRYGKSSLLAALVTGLAVIGTTPYIALQLQSVTTSFAVVAAPGTQVGDLSGLAFWVAAGLAAFTVLFGTRRLDASERHAGIVTAIAVEAIVKLVALVAVGLFVVIGMNGGLGAAAAAVSASPLADWSASPGRWAGLIFVSGAAVICLPRMFHVLVVENVDERQLVTASWAFPAYLMAMCVFVLPIAATGLARLPDGNPDLYVLTLPLSEGRDGLALLAFLGGFSAASSMVIVAAVALATMLSNHVVMPLWLAWQGRGRRATISGDVRGVVLRARRAAIVAVLAMGYLYFLATGGGRALAAIGLISFVGLAQVLPALVFGLFWRGATRSGAVAGVGVGFAVWAWTMLVPVLAGPGALAGGPLGVAWLDPEAMLGIEGDPLLVALILSMGLNVLAFCAVSLATEPTPMEQLQAPRFIGVFERAGAGLGRRGGDAGAEELLVMAQRILGGREARALFEGEARAQGRGGELPPVTPALLERLELRLAGSVGAATAHAMVSGITGDAAVSVEDLLAMADETAEILEYSARLEAQSGELARTAAELRHANDKLTALARQKDAFLSQVSHELRTPMTSIRAFSEILRDADAGEIAPGERAAHAGIIFDESVRLTRLLDDLLDLSVLESGQGVVNLAPVRLGDVIDRAVIASGARGLEVRRLPGGEGLESVTDADRLAQVFINLIANAAKYCDAPEPMLEIAARRDGDAAVIEFADNGSGIAEADRGVIFEKFARLGDQSSAGGAGLGLAICREVMTRLGGTIDYLPGRAGAAFRVRLPGAVRPSRAAE